MKNAKNALRHILLCTLVFSLFLLCSCGENEPTVTEGAPQLPHLSFFSQVRVVEEERYEKAAYGEFYSLAEAIAVIPGLSEGFIPQGMDHSEQKDTLFVSGYFKSTTQCPTSVILAISTKSGALLGEYFLKKPDGTNLTGHVGGVAVTEKNLFLANGERLYRYPLADIDALGGYGGLQAAEAIPVPTAASYCNYANGTLFVGDFYLSPNYETPLWRHLTDKNGKKYGAWCAAYILTDESESELSSTALAYTEYAIPDYILATETKVQGFTAIGDTVVLSCSHGRVNDASLAFYRLDTEGEAFDTHVSLEGRGVPLYFLGPERLQKTVTAPPMTEGVCADGDGVYLLFESAATYYKNGGGLYPVDRIYRVELEKE